MKNKLLQFITSEVLHGSVTDLQTDDDLLTTETIDSMGVMRLVAFVEECCGRRVPPEDVTIENFISIDAICGYLSRIDAG